jgi:hypothetical protein
MMHVVPSTRVVSRLHEHELVDADDCRTPKSMIKVDSAQVMVTAQRTVDCAMI